MKLSLCVCVGILFSFSMANETSKMQADAFGRDNFTYPSGTVLGLGTSLSTYKTKWSEISVLGLPIHNHEKIEVMGYLENRSMFQTGPLHYDVRGELRYGVSGGSEQDYIDTILVEGEGTTISSKGTNFAGGGHFKIAFPFDLTPRVHLAPFVGFGVAFLFLEMTGDGLDQKYTDFPLSNLSYDAGWTETAVYLPVNLGLNIDFETWSLVFDYRRSIVGTTSTNWGPAKKLVDETNTNGPQVPLTSTDQTFQSIGLSLAFRIGR